MPFESESLNGLVKGVLKTSLANVNPKGLQILLLDPATTTIGKAR